MTTTTVTDGAKAACLPALVPSSHASAIMLRCGAGSFLDFRGNDSVPYDFIGGVPLEWGYVRGLGLSVFVAPFLQACSMFHVAANSPHVSKEDSQLHSSHSSAAMCKF
uniref:Uncharacterized protein n=1 Tax=Oryza meridionalis TaxID=40149 RepID=A0A0E0F3W9_9ORYZ